MGAPLLPLATLLMLTCNKIAVPHHPAHFIVKSRSGISVLKSCPASHEFLSSLCRCVRQTRDLNVAPENWKSNPSGLPPHSQRMIQNPSDLTNLQNGDFLQIQNINRVPLSFKHDSSIMASSTNTRQRGRIARMLVPVKRYFPVYFRIYRTPSGKLIRIPIIFRYYKIVPPGTRGAVRARDGNGFLVPIPVLVLNKAGKFVYNPKVYAQYIAMIKRSSHLMANPTSLHRLGGAEDFRMHQRKGSVIHHSPASENMMTRAEAGVGKAVSSNQEIGNINGIPMSTHAGTLHQWSNRGGNRHGTGQFVSGAFLPHGSVSNTRRINTGVGSSGNGVYSRLNQRNINGVPPEWYIANMHSRQRSIPVGVPRGMHAQERWIMELRRRHMLRNMRDRQRSFNPSHRQRISMSHDSQRPNVNENRIPSPNAIPTSSGRRQLDRSPVLSGNKFDTAGTPGFSNGLNRLEQVVLPFGNRNNGKQGPRTLSGTSSGLPGTDNGNAAQVVGSETGKVFKPMTAGTISRFDLSSIPPIFPGSQHNTSLLQPALIPTHPSLDTQLPVDVFATNSKDIFSHGDTDTFNGPLTGLSGFGRGDGISLTSTMDKGGADIGIFPKDKAGNIHTTSQPKSIGGVVGLVSQTKKTDLSSIFPGGITDQTDLGKPIGTGTIDNSVFNGKPLPTLEDPITGLPLGFVPKEPVTIGKQPNVPTQPTVIVDPQPVTVTELVDVPPALVMLLNDHAVLDYLNYLIASGDFFKFVGVPEKFNMPIAYLKTLTMPKVTEYLNYLVTVVNQQTNATITPNKMPSELEELLNDKIFIQYITKRRDNGYQSLMGNRGSTDNTLSTIAITGKDDSDTLIIEGVNGPFNKSDITRFPGLDQVNIVNVDSGNIGEILRPSSGGIDNLPVLPVLPTGGMMPSGEITPAGIVTEVLPIELCMGCKIDGGLGYTNHPSRCDLFVVCYPGLNGEFIPMAQQCPYGLFWSQSALTCKLSKDVHCPHEVCKDQMDKYQYAHKGNCRAYWECNEGYSLAYCCPEGFAFFDGRGCIKTEKGCNVPCPPNKDTNEELLWTGQCDKREIPGSPTKFERHVHFNTQPDMFGTVLNEWVEQECPKGTLFRREVCDCSMAYLEIPHYEYEGHVCSPEVDMPFTYDLFDHSIERTHVRVDNVTRTGGAACFNGHAALAIPKYANMDFGTYFYAKLKYKHTAESGETQALLYNGDCEMKPSMVLGSKPNGNFFSVKTNMGQIHTLYVPSTVPSTDWRTVSITLDGDMIELKTDNFKESLKITGGIARSQCGMKIGWGEDYKNFIGCIDEFQLYRCRPESPAKKRNAIFPNGNDLG